MMECVEFKCEDGKIFRVDFQPFAGTRFETNWKDQIRVHVKGLWPNRKIVNFETGKVDWKDEEFFIQNGIVLPKDFKEFVEDFIRRTNKLKSFE